MEKKKPSQPTSMTEEYTGDAYGVGQGYTNKWRTLEGYKRNIADFRHSNYCHWSLYLTLWSKAQPYRLEKVTVN